MQNLTIYSKQSLKISLGLLRYASINNTKLKLLNSWQNNKNKKQLLFSSHGILNYSCKNVYTASVLLSKINSNAMHKLFEPSCIRLFSTSPKLRSNNKSQKEGSSGGRNDDDDKDKDMDNLMGALRKMMNRCLIGLLLFSLLRSIFGKGQDLDWVRVSWNEFVYHMLMKGEVEEVTIRPDMEMATITVHTGAVIKGERSRAKTYVISIADIDHLEEKIREVEKSLGIKAGEGIPVNYIRRNEFLANAVKILIFGAILYFTTTLFRRGMTMQKDIFKQMTRAKFTLVDSLTRGGKGVRFNDVAGLKEAKIEVMEFVDYLKKPDRYKKLGAKVPRGALLLGPPGCGKTLLAKAVATEADVPFLSMNGSEFIEMIGGLGAARVRDLFAEARKRAPSILYIDEIDAIGRKRAEEVGRSTGESEQTLNQLLVELDGMQSTEGVILLASTNRAEVLDKALLRPGRFDRHILIDLPTLEERKEIFEQHLKKITLEHEPSTYSKRLAYLTPGFSGADIANVCNEAALHAAREIKKTVDADDLSYALDRVIGGSEKKQNAITPTEKRVVAYHESGHALVAWLLENTKAPLKVTIVPRTNLALGFSRYAPQSKKLLTKEDLFENMCVLLGGRVAESLIFNRITSIAQDDFEKVTKMAYSQIQQYGMNNNVGLISFDKDSLDTNTRKPYSKYLKNLMDIEVRQLITDAYQQTEDIIRKNMDKLELIAETLLKKETITYSDVENLIGPPPFGKKELFDPSELENSTWVEEKPPRPSPEPSESQEQNSHA